MMIALTWNTLSSVCVCKSACTFRHYAFSVYVYIYIYLLSFCKYVCACAHTGVTVCLTLSDPQVLKSWLVSELGVLLHTFSVSKGMEEALNIHKYEWYFEMFV